MKIFASAMGDFGNLDLNQIAKGLVAMGGAWAEVAIAHEGDAEEYDKRWRWSDRCWCGT